MMYRFLKTNLFIALVLYALSGCYPKGPESYSDLDLTITDYDPDYNFGAQKYYFMPDTVSFQTNIKDAEIDNKDVQKLLGEIETNFTNRGYKRLDAADIEDAEFVIGVNVIAFENTSVGWAPYPPYYPGWGWGGYYPPYWGAYYTYSYTTGSVFVEWYDPQDEPVIGDDGKLQPVDWVAALNGLISLGSPENSSRIQEGINQAFIQSPYIQNK